MNTRLFKSVAVMVWLFAAAKISDAQICSGCLDSTFANGGAFVLSGTDTGPRGFALQADNKIVALFNENSTATPEIGYLIRLTPDGQLDSSFGSGGVVNLYWGGAGGFVRAVSLQTIGSQIRIVVGGWEPCGTNKQCLRAEAYDTNGVLDPTFGSAGVAHIGSVGCGPDWITTQPADQKLLMVGALCSFTRLTANGQLDTSFGTSGVAATNFLYQVRGAPVVVSSGKILLPGSIQKKGWVDLAVARYNVNGSLDDGGRKDTTPGDSFGVSGVGTAHLTTSNTYANWVAVDGVGNVVIVGNQSNSALMSRLSTSGQLDTTFANSGFAFFTFVTNNFFNAVAIQNDGNYVLAGSGLNSVLGNNDLLLARYLPSGTLDASFGTGGWALYDIFGLYNGGTSPVLMQPDPSCVGCEKILAMGGTSSHEAYLLRALK